MGSLGQIAKYAAAGVAGLLAWNVAAKIMVDNTLNSPAAQAEGEVYKMEREAQRQQPGKPIAVAMNNYAIGKASEELAATASPEERRLKAAQIFIGYYLINTRGRAEYCQERGVDVSAFVDEFARLHRPQYDRAAALLEAKRVTVEKIWSITRGAMERPLKHDMGSYGPPPRPGQPSACEELAKRAKFFARKLDLRERQPDVHSALMG
jgi:hypothetical protein